MPGFFIGRFGHLSLYSPLALTTHRKQPNEQNQ